MKINLLTKKDHDTIQGIYRGHPKLTLENKGYEYIDRKLLSPIDIEAINTVESILGQCIHGFASFSNFRDRKDRIQIRLQYRWNEHFTGVGYVYLDELKNGFDNNEQHNERQKINQEDPA